MRRRPVSVIKLWCYHLQFTEFRSVLFVFTATERSGLHNTSRHDAGNEVSPLNDRQKFVVVRMYRSGQERSLRTISSSIRRRLRSRSERTQRSCASVGGRPDGVDEAMRKRGGNLRHECCHPRNQQPQLLRVAAAEDQVKRRRGDCGRAVFRQLSGRAGTARPNTPRPQCRRHPWTQRHRRAALSDMHRPRDGLNDHFKRRHKRHPQPNSRIWIFVKVIQESDIKSTSARL